MEASKRQGLRTRGSPGVSLSPDGRVFLQLSGTWYMKATASDKEIPGVDLRSMSVTPMTITTLEGGNLQVNFTVL